MSRRGDRSPARPAQKRRGLTRTTNRARRRGSFPQQREERFDKARNHEERAEPAGRGAGRAGPVHRRRRAHRGVPEGYDGRGGTDPETTTNGGKVIFTADDAVHGDVVEFKDPATAARPTVASRTRPPRPTASPSSVKRCTTAGTCDCRCRTRPPVPRWSWRSTTPRRPASSSSRSMNLRSVLRVPRTTDFVIGQPGPRCRHRSWPMRRKSRSQLTAARPLGPPSSPSASRGRRRRQRCRRIRRQQPEDGDHHHEQRHVVHGHRGQPRQLNGDESGHGHGTACDGDDQSCTVETGASPAPSVTLKGSDREGIATVTFISGDLTATHRGHHVRRGGQHQRRRRAGLDRGRPARPSSS